MARESTLISFTSLLFASLSFFLSLSFSSLYELFLSSLLAARTRTHLLLHFPLITSSNLVAVIFALLVHFDSHPFHSGTPLNFCSSILFPLEHLFVVYMDVLHTYHSCWSVFYKFYDFSMLSLRFYCKRTFFFVNLFFCLTKKLLLDLFVWCFTHNSFCPLLKVLPWFWPLLLLNDFISFFRTFFSLFWWSICVFLLTVLRVRRKLWVRARALFGTSTSAPLKLEFCQALLPLF